VLRMGQIIIQAPCAGRWMAGVDSGRPFVFYGAVEHACLIWGKRLMVLLCNPRSNNNIVSERK